MSDDQTDLGDVRLFDRPVAAGLSIERAKQHLNAGRVRVDGELVTDPYLPVPPQARIVLALDGG